MANDETGLAQSIYLANMFAQRNTCQCVACKLLRQATDGMIKQALAGQNPGQGTLDPSALAGVISSLGGSSGGGP